MLHVVTLFSVSPAAKGSFVRSLRVGGDRHMCARSVASQFVVADSLRHNHGSLFLCLDLARGVLPGLRVASHSRALPHASADGRLLN
jgi:hypothetical protein